MEYFDENIKNVVLNAKLSPNDSRDFVFKSSNEKENLNTLDLRE